MTNHFIQIQLYFYLLFIIYTSVFCFLHSLKAATANPNACCAGQVTKLRGLSQVRTADLGNDRCHTGVTQVTGAVCLSMTLGNTGFLLLDFREKQRKIFGETSSLFKVSNSFLKFLSIAQASQSDKC